MKIRPHEKESKNERKKEISQSMTIKIVQNMQFIDLNVVFIYLVF